MSEASVAPENMEATEAWNGPLFEIWQDFQAVVVSNARAHGDAALVDHRPEPGDRVLDLGCGLGDSTVQLAELVGREGHAHGVDVAERMIAGAREDAARADVRNVSFEVADVQVAHFADTYDYAFARFGTMFFANPVAALRNVREALRPGGRLNIVVWRRKLDNEWLHRAETIVGRFLDRPEEYDEPTCGPGPFSMADADTVTDVLKHAGFEGLELKRQDLAIKIGDTSSMPWTSSCRSVPPARSCGCGVIGPPRSAPRSARRCSRAWPTWSATMPSTPAPRPGPSAPLDRCSERSSLGR
jgi:SAM-dependent methyltransferase